LAGPLLTDFLRHGARVPRGVGRCRFGVDFHAVLGRDMAVSTAQRRDERSSVVTPRRNQALADVL